VSFSEASEIHHCAVLGVCTERTIAFGVDADRRVNDNRIEHVVAGRCVSGVSCDIGGKGGTTKCEVFSGDRREETSIVQQCANDQKFVVNSYSVN
jgi:hypothetical protein